jgi:uncharacterized membrane protein
VVVVVLGLIILVLEQPEQAVQVVEVQGLIMMHPERLVLLIQVVEVVVLEI